MRLSFSKWAFTVYLLSRRTLIMLRVSLPVAATGVCTGHLQDMSEFSNEFGLLINQILFGELLSTVFNFAREIAEAGKFKHFHELAWIVRTWHASFVDWENWSIFMCHLWFERLNLRLLTQMTDTWLRPILDGPSLPREWSPITLLYLIELVLQSMNVHIVTLLLDCLWTHRAHQAYVIFVGFVGDK